MRYLHRSMTLILHLFCIKYNHLKHSFVPLISADIHFKAGTLFLRECPSILDVCQHAIEDNICY